MNKPTLTQEQRRSLVHRMYHHTEVKDIAVVVLTARELQELLEYIDYLEGFKKTVEQFLNEGEGNGQP